MRWGISSAIALGCLGIVYSMYVFVAGFAYLDTFEPYLGDVCALAKSQVYFLDATWDYLEMTGENCGQVIAGAAFYSPDDATLSDAPSLAAVLQLMHVGALSAAAWLFLVVLSQAQLMLPEREVVRRHLSRVLETARGLAYCVLFAVAIYWAVAGNLMDAWDAFLWLAAFLIIDVNTFKLAD